MPQASCEHSMNPTTSESSADAARISEENIGTDEEIECAREAEVQKSPDTVNESVVKPKRLVARSISECEAAPDDSQRSILRHPQLAKIRSHLEKRQSFAEPAEERQSTETSNEQDIIERYYQRNQATINSLQSRALATGRRPREARHPVSLASRRSGQSEVVMPSPKVTERKNFSKSFYWVAANHKKIGFRHICMLLLVLIYTLLGALLFYLIESNYEKNIVVIRKDALDRTIFGIATEMTNKVNDPDETVNVTMMEDYIKRAYVTLLQQESAYKGSTFYKSEDPDNNYKWTFGSAFFFSMNVYTTTGYGSIAPESIAGKSCVMVYGFIFVPLTLVVLRDLGQWALVHTTKIYARLLIMFRRARGYEDNKDDELISLPIKFCMFLMLAYLLFASLFIYEYDALSGPAGSGIDFFHSFYFSFISITTIGLGDIMPNNVTFAPIITLLFFFGMPILKVVNRSTYICVENGVFGTMTVFENRLDSCWTGVQPNDTEAQAVSPRPSIRSRRSGSEGRDGDSSDEENGANQMLNNFTIRSIATFMRSHSDVYGGDFGRVNLRRGDLLPHNHDTVRSMSSATRRTSQSQTQTQTPR
ncbi:Ion channel [Trichostrongylus colubriformis]|uniref:Ion channel n=1 Tax=Trichostrongylus colubriformis TaxID=6319 RepID=A0AAN8F8Q6_TRICO